MAKVQTNQNKRIMMESVRKSKLMGKSVNANWSDDKIYINDSLINLIEIYFLKLEYLLVKWALNSFSLRTQSCLLKKNECTKAILSVINY